MVEVFTFKPNNTEVTDSSSTTKRLQLRGLITSNQVIEIDDHGFEVVAYRDTIVGPSSSDTIVFLSDTIMIYMGPTLIPSQLDTSIARLNHVTYFVRAFVVEGSDTRLGNQESTE